MKLKKVGAVQPERCGVVVEEVIFKIECQFKGVDDANNRMNNIF